MLENPIEKCVHVCVLRIIVPERPSCNLARPSFVVFISIVFDIVYNEILWNKR
jgi:hypothetical protein